MSSTTSTAPSASHRRSRFVVAVGPTMCGKSMALQSLIEKSAAKYAIKVPHSEGLRQNHVDALLKKKKCTTLTVESLLDVDARDTFSTLIKRVAAQCLDGKHVHQETQSFFEVPQALRQHVDTVIMFRDANEDERRRVFRYFAQSFFAERSQFDDALNALQQKHDCLLMDKHSSTVRVYNAKRPDETVLIPLLEKKKATENIQEGANNDGDAAKKDAGEAKGSEKPSKGSAKWFWSWFGY